MAIVFFDLETGGLEPEHPITQLAAVVVHQGQEVASFERLLRFDPATCEPTALELQHYDPARWEAEAVDEQDALTAFVEFCRGFTEVAKVSRKGNSYRVARIAGHNAADFDFPRLSARCKAYDIFLPVDWSVLDTLHLARWYFLLHGQGPESLRLEELCRWFDVAVVSEDLHGALTDARATSVLALTLCGLLQKGVRRHEQRTDSGQ